MRSAFHRGDHVWWNSEAGRVSGIVTRKVTSALEFKGYVHHASKEEPQYLIKSDKTSHIALHKGSALRLIRRHRLPKGGQVQTRRAARSGPGTKMVR
jgi:hypothetical protein